MLLFFNTTKGVNVRFTTFFFFFNFPRSSSFFSPASHYKKIALPLLHYKALMDAQEKRGGLAGRKGTSMGEEKKNQKTNKEEWRTYCGFFMDSHCLDFSSSCSCLRPLSFLRYFTVEATSDRTRPGYCEWYWKYCTSLITCPTSSIFS